MTFFSHAPSKNDFTREGIDTETNEHLEEILGVSSTTQKKLPISFGVLKLEEMFKDAENLLSIKDGVTTAASNDSRVRTVKNANSGSR